jgi:hypothetical protein
MALAQLDLRQDIQGNLADTWVRNLIIYNQNCDGFR